MGDGSEDRTAEVLRILAVNRCYYIFHAQAKSTGGGGGGGGGGAENVGYVVR